MCMKYDGCTAGHFDGDIIAYMICKSRDKEVRALFLCYVVTRTERERERQ